VEAPAVVQASEGRWCPPVGLSGESLDGPHDRVIDGSSGGELFAEAADEGQSGVGPGAASDGPLGPMLSLEELGADKLLALFDRAQARDFVDVAALVDRFGLVRLCDLASEKDARFSRSVLVEIRTGRNCPTSHPELGHGQADVPTCDLTCGHGAIRGRGWPAELVEATPAAPAPRRRRRLPCRWFDMGAPPRARLTRSTDRVWWSEEDPPAALLAPRFGVSGRRRRWSRRGRPGRPGCRCGPSRPRARR
jgi:hypothetical protein